jgi:endonuclease YncB( thermonuclease family)
MSPRCKPARRLRGILVGGALLVFLAASAVALAALVDQVMGAKNSKVYHLYPEECSTAKRINQENVIRFASAEEAERSGRRPCKTCETIRAKRQLEGGSGKAGPPAVRPDQRNEGKDRPPPTTQPGINDSAGGPDLPQFARVTGVLVGGTLELDIGEKARLLGVAGPAEGQSFAEDAVRFLTEQTRGRTVRLSKDPADSSAVGRDSLGRLFVYVTPQPDGRDLGGELIFQGYAWVDREARFDRRAEYARHEEEAWRDHRGIWRPLTGEAGKREVLSGRFAHDYHDPKCPHVPHLTGMVKMTVNEAKSRRLPPCPLHLDKEKPGSQTVRRSEPRRPEPDQDRSGTGQ